MAINPIKLTGIWTEGYALDKHMVSSKYIGEDVFGHKQFDNEYTEIGTLLYKMKYNGHYDTSLDILNLATPFLDEWMHNKKIDIILPAPPTKHRDIQPIYIIAETIAKHYGIPYSDDVLGKTGVEQSKDMVKENTHLTGTINLIKKPKRNCNILLVDDLFSTGSTLNECTHALRTDSLINSIYVITITKTG